MVEPRVGLFKERVYRINNLHVKQISFYTYLVQNHHINQYHVKCSKITGSPLQVLSPYFRKCRDVEDRKSLIPPLGVCLHPPQKVQTADAASACSAGFALPDHPDT